MESQMSRCSIAKKKVSYLVDSGSVKRFTKMTYGLNVHGWWGRLFWCSGLGRWSSYGSGNGESQNGDDVGELHVDSL
jgi:hypothetical protein